jgi:hypothetical protein
VGKKSRSPHGRAIVENLKLRNHIRSLEEELERARVTGFNMSLAAQRSDFPRVDDVAALSEGTSDDEANIDELLMPSTALVVRHIFKYLGSHPSRCTNIHLIAE